MNERHRAPNVFNTFERQLMRSFRNGVKTLSELELMAKNSNWTKPGRVEPDPECS